MIDLDKLEALAKTAKATSAIDNRFYDAAREALPALIARVRELEAQSLAMQPRPLSAIEGPALLHWQGRWFVCWKAKHGGWVSVENGNIWSATDMAYPLSSLPKAAP